MNGLGIFVKATPQSTLGLEELGELWHRVMTFPAQSGYFATDKPNSRFRGKQPMVRGVCFTFNAGRPCVGCRYDHKCSKCGGRHAATSCHSAPNIPNQPEIALSQLHHIINSPPVTPLTSTLSPLLQQYDPRLKQFLIDGFSFGFRVAFVDTSRLRLASNLRSAKEQPEILAAKLEKELCAGRIYFFTFRHSSKENPRRVSAYTPFVIP